MAAEKKPKAKPVRLVVRVHIPSIDPGEAGSVHAAVSFAVKAYPKAEVELSIMPPLPAR